MVRRTENARRILVSEGGGPWLRCGPGAFALDVAAWQRKVGTRAWRELFAGKVVASPDEARRYKLGDEQELPLEEVA